MCGICAGVKESGVKIGDILIASQSWDYESGKIAENQNGELVFSPEIHNIPTEQGLLSRLTEFITRKEVLSSIYNNCNYNKPGEQLRAHIGPVASGPYLLSSEKYLAKLKEKERKLIGIDMEGYGIYKAAQFNNNIIPILIKSVSDYGEKGKSDEFQKFASYTSANFVYEFILNTF